MPNLPISELVELTNPTATDVLAIVNAGQTKKITVTNLLLEHDHTSASVLSLIAGTSTDGIADLQTLLDGNVYHINEVAAAPGYDLRLTFADITNIYQIIVRFYYAGGTTHGCRVQIYNNSTTNWDTLLTEVGSDVDMSLRTIFLVDDTAYIDGSNQVIIRFYHTELGNASHDVYIDYIGIVSV